MKLLDGKALAVEIEAELAAALKSPLPRRPCLAFILVGEHAPSRTYVRMKQKRCHEVGILSKPLELPEGVEESELLKQIKQLNLDPTVDGILVQMPLPRQINAMHIMAAVDPEKDVDGFHPMNMGRLLQGGTEEETPGEGTLGFVPCTPLGIMRLLRHYQIPTEGKHAVIVGRGQIVGKPLAMLLMQKHAGANATVTVVHSKSEGLVEICRSADIIIAALGVARFVVPSMVRPGAVVVDVGINRLSTGEIVGDVDFEQVAPLTSYITPVPGGIGPLTIAMLLSNTVRSFQRWIEHS